MENPLLRANALLRHIRPFAKINICAVFDTLKHNVEFGYRHKVTVQISIDNRLLVRYGATCIIEAASQNLV